MREDLCKVQTVCYAVSQNPVVEHYFPNGQTRSGLQLGHVGESGFSPWANKPNLMSHDRKTTFLFHSKSDFFNRENKSGT